MTSPPDTPSRDTVSRRRYERERAARLAAERMLEQKSREIFEANKALSEQASSLERMVAKRTEDLEAARIDAERANAAKSAFLVTMSHEIRTPINGMLGTAQALRELPLEQEVREGVSTILDSGRVLLRIVNDVLDLSRIEAGKIEVEEESIHLVTLLRAAQALYRARAQECGLEFRFEEPDQLPPAVQADPARIRQIVHNLLSNALNFTPRGHVCLRLRWQTETAGRIRAFIDVEDTGVGIAQEDVSSMFSPFVQVSGVHGRDAGTGLGLSIAARLADALGGSLSVESVKDQGSRFTLELGLETSTHSPRKEATTERALSVLGAFRPRVLAADDNATNRKVLGLLTRKFPIEIEQVESGEAAIARAREMRFDLLVLDIRMPGKDGIQTLHEIRSDMMNAAGTAPAAIALSANIMPDQKQSYFEAGFEAVLGKPVRKEELLCAMAESLRARDGVLRGAA